MPTVTTILKVEQNWFESPGNPADEDYSSIITIGQNNSVSVEDGTGSIYIQHAEGTGTTGLVEYGRQRSYATWIDLGVPAWKRILSVSIDSLYTRAGSGAPWTYPNIGWVSLYLVDSEGAILGDTHLARFQVIPSTTWNQVAGSGTVRMPIEVASMASVKLRVRYEIDGTQWPGDTYYVDYITLIIEYGDLGGYGGSGGGVGGGDDGGGVGGGGGGGGRWGEGDLAPDDHPRYKLKQSCRDIPADEPVGTNLGRYASAWVSDGIYYLTHAGRTLAFDTATQQWTDVGYGHLLQPCVVQMKDAPDIVFAFRHEYGHQGYDELDSLYEPMYDPIVICRRFRPGNSDAPWVRRVILGPYDGSPKVRDRRKRAIVLRLWGSITDELPDGINIVGEMTLSTDEGYVETRDVMIIGEKAGAFRLPPDVLLEQHFSPAAQGRVFMVDIHFWRSDNKPLQCITLKESQMEMILL